MSEKVTNLHPDFLKEIRWAINQVKRINRGSLRDDATPVPPAADGYFIKTPPEGIPARDQMTISSAECELYREVLTAQPGERLLELVEIAGQPATVRTWNIETEDLEADEIYPTALTKSGTRYAITGESAESTPALHWTNPLVQENQGVANQFNLLLPAAMYGPTSTGRVDGKQDPYGVLVGGKYAPVIPAAGNYWFEFCGGSLWASYRSSGSATHQCLTRIDIYFSTDPPCVFDLSTSPITAGKTATWYTTHNMLLSTGGKSNYLPIVGKHISTWTSGSTFPQYMYLSRRWNPDSGLTDLMTWQPFAAKLYRLESVTWPADGQIYCD